MNIVIAGDGDVGIHLANMLAKEEHNITIITPNKELTSIADDNANVMAVTGDPVSLSSLSNANVKNCDLFISVLHDENPNILACILSKKLGAKKTIARINNIEFLEEKNSQFFQTLGVAALVSPERIASNEIFELLHRTEATESLSFDNGLLHLFQFRLNNKSEIIGGCLEELSKKYRKLEFMTIAIMRDEKAYIPQKSEILKENDLIYVISTSIGLKELFKISGRTHEKVKNLMVIGASRVGKKTAKLFEEDANVKLIEKDRSRCEAVAGEFNGTLVINGDATDIDLLEEEGIAQMDAFVATTNNSETNILTCFHAKRAGVKHSIALVENIDFITLSQSIGIDAIINKKLITAGYLASFTLGPQIKTSKVLSGIDAEVFEFMVEEHSKITKKAIYQLDFPKNAIIAGIIRNDKAYIALSHFRIQAQDRVIVLALPDSIMELPQFFN
ncbi:MAG: Trk system potassium transporter TrkA [Bacteroidales bacterium]|jgi:trk system potassium uptake protein TrkA|nr:Trk system potassium transporter TrkA [Bacteroidales bacterium]